MSFERCKIYLKANLSHYEHVRDKYRLEIINLQNQIDEKIARRKRICKWRDIQCLREAIDECKELIDLHNESLNQFETELADLLRMEVLVGLVPDVESKKGGRL